MKHGAQPGGPPVNPNPDYQDRDIALGPLKKFIAVTFLVVAIAMVAMWGLHRAVVTRERAAFDAVPSFVKDRQIAPGTGTLLQSNEAADLRRFLDEQNAVMTSYAWVNKDKGIARIPVDRAMTLAFERKLFPVEKK